MEQLNCDPKKKKKIKQHFYDKINPTDSLMVITDKFC